MSRTKPRILKAPAVNAQQAEPAAAAPEGYSAAAADFAARQPAFQPLAAYDPADVFAAAASALQRISGPARQMLMRCIAIRGEASGEVCELLGLRQIDLAMFSAAHHDELLAVRSCRAAGVLHDRTELGYVLRACVVEMKECAESAADFEAVVRAGARLPDWAFEPQAAAAQATMKLQESRVRDAENEARCAEAAARRAIAEVRQAEPLAYAGSRMELIEDPLPEADPPGYVNGWPELSFEESIDQAKRLISLIEEEQRFNEEAAARERAAREA